MAALPSMLSLITWRDLEFCSPLSFMMPIVEAQGKLFAFRLKSNSRSNFLPVE
jgi:hypothetical protein